MASTDALTSNALIESVKRRASVPENQSTFDVTDFLEFANEELRLGVVPKMMSLHEDFLLFEQNVPLQSNTNSYQIPSRAIGNKLRDLQFLTGTDNYSEMTRIGIGDRFSEYDVRSETNLKQYYIKNNKVVLKRVGSNPSGSLSMIFYIRPSKMVAEDRVGIITGINRAAGTVTINAVPADFNTSIVYDFYKAESPHSILAIDKSAITLNTTTRTLSFATEDIPEDLEVGDHLAQAGECIIPQIPSELHVMLAQMVACRVLESLGDSEGLKNALVKLGQMDVAAGMIIDNRVEDSPQKIVNRHGTLRTSIFSKRFNRR